MGSSRTPDRIAGEGRLASLLVVDDNAATGVALSRLLQEQGYTVAVSTGGTQALDELGRRAFDLILLDVMMQDMSGLDLLRVIRRDRSAMELPVIMATARDESADIVGALQLGANDYVTKPLDFPVLLARIQTQLSLKNAVKRVVRLEDRLAQRNQELEAANARLTAANAHMERDLELAARVQEAFLPQACPQFAAAKCAWLFKPCAQLAGDTLNVFALDEQHLGLYVLDVSGHGVAAALRAVALSHVLSPMPETGSILVRRPEGARGPELVTPAEVARILDRRFPWDPATDQYFTIVYGILDMQTGELRYVSAGHPGPIHLPPERDPVLLDAPRLPIGVGGGTAAYEDQVVCLEPGDRLYLYSDGLFEAVNGAGEAFGKVRLQEFLLHYRAAPLAEGLGALWEDVGRWCGAPPPDDISVLAVEFTGAPRRRVPASARRKMLRAQ